MVRPMVGVTDCCNLFDAVHREGSVELPLQRRLSINVAAVLEMLLHESPDYDPRALHHLGFAWVHTLLQQHAPLRRTWTA